ncbi:MAG: hypothetical protein KDI75_11525 [Xanthomonadales bacterium]|nr:hypothetical protein [Xanthomonadales bacterium]
MKVNFILGLVALAMFLIPAEEGHARQMDTMYVTACGGSQYTDSWGNVYCVTGSDWYIGGGGGGGDDIWVPFPSYGGGGGLGSVWRRIIPGESVGEFTCASCEISEEIGTQVQGEELVFIKTVVNQQVDTWAQPDGKAKTVDICNSSGTCHTVAPHLFSDTWWVIP